PRPRITGLDCPEPIFRLPTPGILSRVCIRLAERLAWRKALETVWVRVGVSAAILFSDLPKTCTSPSWVVASISSILRGDPASKGPMSRLMDKYPRWDTIRVWYPGPLGESSNSPVGEVIV